MINIRLIVYSDIEPLYKEVGWLHKINDVLVLSFYHNGEWKYTSSGITEELINAIGSSVGLDPDTKIYTNTGLYIGKLVVNTVTSDIKALDTLTKSNTDNITTLQTGVIEAKTEVKGLTDKVDVVSSIDTDGHTIYTILLDPNFLAIINGIPEQTNAIIDGQLNTGGTIDTAILNKASLFNTGLLGSLTVTSTDPTPGKNGYYVYTDSGTNTHGTIDAGDTLLVTYDNSVYTYTLIKKYNNINIEYAKNNTGSTVGRGKLIYISGSTGDNPLLLLATNTDYNIAVRTWGMTYDGISANAVGRVIHFGLIENLDTSAYTAGTELWLGVNGEFTNVRPTLPTTQIYIGMVIRSSATVGSIFIDLRHVSWDVPLVVNLTNTSGVYSADKTSAEIISAFDSKSLIVFKYVDGTTVTKWIVSVSDPSAGKVVAYNDTSILTYQTSTISFTNVSDNIRTYDAGVIPTIENGTDNDYKQAAINLVPESLHVGGMTVLYSKQGDITKQSIFLPLSSFSTTPEDWFISPLIEEYNPEFIDAKIDVKRNLLESTDYKGNKKFYADVEVYGELKSKTFDGKVDKIEGKQLSTNDYNNVEKQEVAKIPNKVDKEEGKSLIDDEIKECFRVIENEEFIKAVVDAENRILVGIKYDGEPYFPNHEMYSVIGNNEWLYAIIDAEENFLCGFRADDGHMIVGAIDLNNAIIDLNNAIIDVADIKERTAHLSTIENDEYLSIETDAEGKVIGYTAPDGSHYLYKVKSETIPEEFYHIEDTEGRTEITTDAEDKVMSYRDADGKKHEQDMEVTNLDVSNLNLQGNSINNIQDALKANGFNVKTPIDWSDYLSNDGDNPLYIHEPRYAIINISGIDSMPTEKVANEKAYFEMWDMQGNYFKKKVIMNAQGNTTMYFPKKSFACDFFDNDWNGDSFAIKIGDWVPQDSFHFKAQYTDFFKGISIVAYKLIQEVWASRSPIYSNPWKKALLSTINITSGSWNNNGVNDLSIQKDTGAKCIPDAFPCAVYLNGIFYGVFNWALKKHRDNYHLNKSLATNIHLDGGASPMFSPLDWSKFEIRNPKNLITKSNETYDGDYPSELIDSTIEGYDASNKNHILSNKVKSSIIAFNSYGRTLNSMTKENGGDEFLNEHFDLDNLIDFFVSQYILADEDIENNWQWVTYDGIKWFICDYDKDRAFGQTYMCPGVMNASNMINPNKVSNDNYPFKYLYNYHKDDIKIRYNELKSLGIFTPEHVISLVVNWFNRIPAADLKMEYKKWYESPSNRDDNVDREHWKINKISYIYDSSYNEYDNSKTYQIGELCIYGRQQKALFECVKETAGNPPITKFYTNIPYDLGYHDSIWRVIKYITERFNNVENELNNI